ncbi:MAG: aminoacyl-tRNA deacylase [Anaerolineae bacterium]
MPTPQVKAYLDEHDVEYETIPYEHAYDAQHVAAAAHVSGKQLVKTVVVKVDDRLVMAVVPADARVDFERLKAEVGANRAALAKESDFKGLFGDCDVGAMPPFGPLYGIDVFVDETLTLADKVACRGGTHGELIQMPYEDFELLAAPQVLTLAYRR